MGRGTVSRKGENKSPKDIPSASERERERKRVRTSRAVVLKSFFAGRKIIMREREKKRISWFFGSDNNKETTLERADFALQLLLFVTKEKGGQMFIIFFLFIFFVSCCPHGFKLGQAECLQTMKAQTDLPRRHLFLI